MTGKNIRKVYIVRFSIQSSRVVDRSYLLVHPASNSSSSFKVSPPQSTHTSTSSSSRASFPGLGLIVRPNSPSPLVDRALSYFSNYTDAPIVRWLRTHADDPWSAGKRWVVERFQFGISMFDPLGLKTRYAHLVDWQGGLWVNYWTQTVPRAVQNNQPASGQGSHIATQTSTETLLDNDNALLVNGIISSGVGDEHTAPEGTNKDELPQSSNPLLHSPSSQPLGTATSQTTPRNTPKKVKQVGKSNSKEKNKQEKGKHFIVLPKGLGHVLGGVDKWERVLIGGVDDEVSAHTGLFKPNQNLGYEDLVERVEARILGWCENLKR